MKQEPTIHAEGSTFWTLIESAARHEAITHSRIDLDDETVQWLISTLSDKRTSLPIASSSPEVRRYIRRVLDEMKRHSPRPLRAVPKPTKQTTRRARTVHVDEAAIVACPLCQGEAWSDCECCGGEGTMTARQAAIWQEHH